MQPSLHKDGFIHENNEGIVTLEEGGSQVRMKDSTHLSDARNLLREAMTAEGTRDKYTSKAGTVEIKDGLTHIVLTDSTHLADARKLLNEALTYKEEEKEKEEK